MIFITRFMNSFLHQASFATGYWYYDRHRSVRLVILVGLAIDQIAQSGLSSLSVIYYSAQLFSNEKSYVLLLISSYPKDNTTSTMKMGNKLKYKVVYFLTQPTLSVGCCWRKA